MTCYILFGLPGAGKTFVGTIFEKYFDFYVYDGDTDIPPDLRSAVNNREIVTDDMRDRFFTVLIKKIASLLLQHKRLIVTQTFIKDKYRKELLKKIPQVQFILITSNKDIREQRLKQRNYFPSNVGYARQMSASFDNPSIEYKEIINNEDGIESIKKQIEKII